MPRSSPVVPASKVGSKADRARAKTVPEEDQPVLLFRACKYGNNKHKKKYSTVVRPSVVPLHCAACSLHSRRCCPQVTAANHASFHAALSQIVKTKVDVATADVRTKGPQRVAKVKKATE